MIGLGSDKNLTIANIEGANSDNENSVHLLTVTSQDFMYFRGLRWPGMPKKSKKKKKR